MKTTWKIIHTTWAFAVMAIPAGVFFLLRGLAEPSGFWQELAVGVIGLFFLGTLQIVLIIFYITFLIGVWD